MSRHARVAYAVYILEVACADEYASYACVVERVNSIIHGRADVYSCDSSHGGWPGQLGAALRVNE